MTTLRNYVTVEEVGNEFLVRVRLGLGHDWVNIGYLATKEAADKFADSLEEDGAKRVEYIELAEDNG